MYGSIQIGTGSNNRGIFKKMKNYICKKGNME